MRCFRLRKPNSARWLRRALLHSALALLLTLVCTLSGCQSKRPPPGAAPTSGVGAPADTGVGPRAPSGKLDLVVAVDAAGTGLSIGGIRIGSDCKTRAQNPSAPTVPARADGSVDAGALTVCARTLKDARADPDEIEGVTTAMPETPYESVIAVLDALRADARGQLFPEIRLRPPIGVASPPVPTAELERLGAAPTKPASKDETDLVVALSKTQMIVGDESVVAYELDDVRAQGLPASAKPRGRGDTFILPLATALVHARQAGHAGSAVSIVADKSIPYRALYEVIYTADAVGITKYHFLVLQKSTTK